MALTKDEEFALAERMHAGDIDARNDLVLSVYPWVVALSQRYLRTAQMPPHDLSQHCMLSLLNQIHRFDPERGRLTTFAATIVHTACCLLAKQRRCQKRYGKFASVELNRLADRATVDPAERLHVRDVAKGIMEASMHLTGVPRECWLLWLDGRNQTEISKVRGTSFQAVAQSMKTAVRKIRELLPVGAN